MGRWLLLRGNDRLAIFFQCGNVIGDDFPGGFGVNGTVAVRHDITHGLNLPPGDGGMLFPELIR